MISIAMATYNGENYLREQVESILRQSIQDFELVIGDDNSSDGTFDILERYSHNDNRIRVFKNSVNLGFKKNFDKIIRRCQGEYIALCDQDDIWTPDHLETLVTLIGDKMLACGNTELIDGEGHRIGMTLKEMEAFDHIPESDLSRAYSVFFFRNPFQGASMLMKKEFFTVALPIADGVQYHDTWFSMVSCFYGGGVYTDKIIGYYRMHGNNVTGNRIVRKSRFRFFILHLLKENMIFDREAILKGLEILKIANPQFVGDAKRYVLHNKTIYGRFLNFLFLLRNYKTIYNC